MMRKSHLVQLFSQLACQMKPTILPVKHVGQLVGVILSLDFQMNSEKLISISSQWISVSIFTMRHTTSSLSINQTCSVLVRKMVARMHAKVTLVDPSSVPTMANQSSTVSLHGAMVVLRRSIRVSTLQLTLKESMGGLSHIWVKIFIFKENTVHNTS